MAPKKIPNKKCFVPCCNNSSEGTPDKVFFSVPAAKEARKRWFDAVLLQVNEGSARFYCCEDHFNLEDDMENFIKFKLTGCAPQMKKNVVPHNFITLALPEFDVSQISPKSKRRQKAFVLGNFLEMEEVDVGAIYGPSTSKQARTDVENVSSPLTILSTASLGENITDSSEYVPESTGSSQSDEFDEDRMKEISKQRITPIIESATRFYLGLPKEIYTILKLAETLCRLPHRNILIVLKKIRLNDPYIRLGKDFGVSTSYVSKIFNDSVKPLAQFMQNLIIWPENDIYARNMPIVFRKRYFKVKAIIDCFETEIEKPSNPEWQALTWSEYYKCNTIKYMISITPFGTVNFISSGFGGRITDFEILQNSGFVNKLKDGDSVMADRGFKNCSKILLNKNCLLVRPPSVSAGEILSKERSREGKQIASLRIHVERAISRIREFAMLKPHSCIDIKLLKNFDSAVIIASGIINLQPPLL